MLLAKCWIRVGIIRIIRIDTPTGSPLLHFYAWRAAVDSFVKPDKLVIIVQTHSVSSLVCTIGDMV